MGKCVTDLNHAGWVSLSVYERYKEVKLAGNESTNIECVKFKQHHVVMEKCLCSAVTGHVLNSSSVTYTCSLDLEIYSVYQIPVQQSKR